MAEGNYLRYLWTSIWLGLGTLLGIMFVIWFSLTSNLSIGLMLLWSFAYLAIGGLLGFIFSVPKLISDSPTADGVGNLTNAQSIKARYQENTNLTQISDWLTKVLIGASLVQMKEIPKFVYHVAEVTGRGAQCALRSTPCPECLSQHLTVCCAAVIIYFITWGFISGYLLMKLVLTEQFMEAGK